jgi:predicted amidohydrolase
MRVSVIQMVPSPDLSHNLREARRLIEECVAADRPDFIALPECWTCIGADLEQTRANGQAFARPGSQERGGEAYELLRDLARRHGIFVHGGSVGEMESGKLYNTTVAFARDGSVSARYRKIHMADVVMPDGTAAFESDRYAAGCDPVVFDAGGTRVGCAICYDLRFPELFYMLRRDGAELIVLPAVFPLQTGKDHWETLLRARAIETQCWIAAPNTHGAYNNASGTHHTYGHSLICNPWGQVVAMASDGAGWATARMDRAMTEKVRREITLMAHRRLISARTDGKAGIALPVAPAR